MIAYARKYMLQSFRHYATRYEALLSLQQDCEKRANAVAGAAKTRLLKRAETVAQSGQLLADVEAMALSLLVFSCLDNEGGCFQGASEVQTTEQVSFHCTL